MKVLGLDVSTFTGVAVVEGGGNILYTGEINYPKLRGMERCGAIAGRVLRIIEELNPDFVVIENYGFANANSLATLVEVGTVIRYFLYQENVPYLVVPPNSLKKFVTGKGNAAKDQMMMAVLKNWGHESKTNNIADAIGLAMFGLCCSGERFTAARALCCDEVLKGQPEVAEVIRLAVQKCT